MRKRGSDSPVKHLRQAAVGGALAPIILMLALAGMLSVSFKDMIDSNKDMHNRYREQMVLEKFPVVLGNLLMPMQALQLANAGQASEQLTVAGESFHSHFARAAAIRHLEVGDKDALRDIQAMVEEAVDLAKGMAGSDVAAPYTRDTAIIAQHLVMVAQRQISELNERVNRSLAEDIDVASNRIFMLLGANCAVLVCLALSVMMFRRRLMASLKVTVSALGDQLSQTADAIMKTVDNQAELANKDITAVDRLKRKLAEMSDDCNQLVETADDVEKVTSAMIRVAQSGLDSADETSKYLKEIGEIIDGIEQGSLQAEDQDAKVQRLVDAMKEISEEAHLVRLNASIEPSGGGKRHALMITELRGLDEGLRELAGEMEDVIEKVRAATRSSLELTRSGMQEVPSGEDIIKRAGDTLQRLQNTSAKVSESARGIAEISRQQHESGHRVSELVLKLSESILEHAEEVRRFRDHAFSLNKLTEEMRDAL
ncbi:MAG: methyl-accepting chemotaxis protein [Mariprofundaceae bacterium]